MKVFRIVFLFLLVCSLTFVSCGDEQSKKEQKIKIASKQFKKKLDEVNNLRQTLIGKQSTIVDKENFFQAKISEIKQEILGYSEGQVGTYEQVVQNRQLTTRLENLRKYHAYLNQISEFKAKVAIAIDDLLGVERQFEADYQMLSLSEEIKIDELIKQVDAVIQKHLPYANDLVLNIQTDESLEDVWKEIKVEKDRAEEFKKLQEEAIRLEKERAAKAEQARLKKERLEKERLEKERLKKERAEQARLEKERLEKERVVKAEQARIKAEEELCQRTPSCLLNREIEEEIRSGFYIRINQLTNITPDATNQIVKGLKDKREIDLSGLQSLSSEAAHNLAPWIDYCKSENWRLKLNGLQSLSVETASELVNWPTGITRCGGFSNRCSLELNGLTSLPENVAFVLQRWHFDYIADYISDYSNYRFSDYRDYQNWKRELCLNGLKTISRESLQALAKWEGSKLSLLGIKELPYETAVFLSKQGRKYFNVELSDSLKKQLITYGIDY